MSLQELVNLIKKSYFVLILLGLVVAVGIGVFIYLDNPSGDQGFGKLPTLNFKTTLSDKITVKSSQNLTTELRRLTEVYKANGLVDAATLIEKLAVSGTSVTDKDFLRWGTLSKDLVINQKENQFSYSLKTNVGGKIVDEGQAFQKALEKLTAIGLIGPDVAPEKVKTSYLFGGFYHVEEVPKGSNFNIFAFEIGIKLDSLSLVNETGSKSIFKIQVGVDGEIRKVDGPLQKLVFVEKSTYPVKHLSTISEEVSQGKAKVVDIKVPVNPKVNKELLVVYSSDELVYLFSGKQQEFLQPVILLQTGNYYSGSQVVALLPALVTQVYKGL